uniref:arginine--tRNA ligase n=1 Tax=Ditylenchus dipsaci TaxID=166011 RepID=A0A915EGX1_9BILA
MSSLIAHRLSAGGDVKVSPEEIAKSVVENLPEIALIQKVEVVRVYVNVFPWNSYSKSVQEKGGHRFLLSEHRKQMHVGHLRSTVIGESLARLMEYMGFEVLRLNHVGDWGTQFGMLIAHLQDRFPDYLTETPAVQDLQLFYKESRIVLMMMRTSKPEPTSVSSSFKIMKRTSTKLGTKFVMSAVKTLVKYTRDLIFAAGKRRVIYQSRMLDVIVELERANVLREEDGRKVEREWVLYVVDRGQSEHLETIFAAGKDLGWYDPNYKRVEHVQFGVVLGADKKKFKTRSGDTVRLTDLLDEGLSRATAKLVEKGRKEELTTEQFEAARESIAYGCVKYADLCHARTSDYAFSFDKMLEDRGNTAVYLLYAYARIRSIARSAQISRERIESYVTGLGDASLQLNDPAEIRLAKQILKFSDCLLDVLENLMPTKMQSDSKDAVTGEAVIQFNRLVLCEVTADVMLQSFKILGLRALEKM